MSNKRKSRRLLKFFTGLVVIGMVMFLIPVGNVFGDADGDGDGVWDCPIDLVGGTGNPQTLDGGNGADYFVKYDHAFVGPLTFPGDYLDSDPECPDLCDNFVITEVVIKTGRGTTGPDVFVYHPVTGFVGAYRDGNLLTDGYSTWYTVSFSPNTTSATSATVTDNQVTGAHAISHAEFYYKCEVVTTGSIELTKSGLQGSDTVDFTLTCTSPSYSQKYTVSAATPTATWTDLAHGQYTLTETPGSGNAYIYTLTVTPSGPYNIGDGAGESLLYTLSADNDAKGKIELTKSGLQGSDTVDFTLTCTSPSYSQKYTVSAATPTATWTDLAHGQYTLTETPGSGNAHIYTLTVTPSGPYNIGDGAGESLLYTINATNSEVKAYIRICKEADENITATEFHFKITNSNIADIPVTVDAGTCSAKIGLPLGTYTVEETDIGYTVTIKVNGVEKKKGISPQSVEVILDEDDIGDTITVLFENDPGLGKIKLTKSGLEAGATAYFKLTDGTDYYNIDGKKNTDPLYKGEPVTSSSNVVTWSDMPWGTYTFEETIPAGYTFGGYTPGKTVIIDETNQAATVAVIATNTKTNGGDADADADADADGDIEVLAFTGFDMINYIIGLVLILIGGIGSVYLTRMLRRKEE